MNRGMGVLRIGSKRFCRLIDLIVMSLACYGHQKIISSIHPFTAETHLSIKIDSNKLTISKTRSRPSISKNKRAHPSSAFQSSSESRFFSISASPTIMNRSRAEAKGLSVRPLTDITVAVRIDLCPHTRKSSRSDKGRKRRPTQGRLRPFGARRCAVVDGFLLFAVCQWAMCLWELTVCLMMTTKRHDALICRTPSRIKLRTADVSGAQPGVGGLVWLCVLLKDFFIIYLF